MDTPGSLEAVFIRNGVGGLQNFYLCAVDFIAISGDHNATQRACPVGLEGAGHHRGGFTCPDHVGTPVLGWGGEKTRQAGFWTSGSNGGGQHVLEASGAGG